MEAITSERRSFPVHISRKRLCRPILSLSLAAALLAQPVLAAGQPTVPQGWTSPFSDVTQGAWYYPFVAVLNSQGVIAGYPDGRFGPKDPISAGAALVMVLKATGCGDLEPLQDAHYAASYANYAVSRGWLTWDEIPDDLNGAVSRLFVAQLAAKALGLEPAEGGSSPFADVDDGYVTALQQGGIVNGSIQDGVRVFCPESSITRAEVSAIVWQVQEYASHIRFGSHTLDILPGVPASVWDKGAFLNTGGRMTYTGQGAEPALGVDVSSHQGDIDWEAVAGDGIDFAMIRAGGRYYGKDSGTIFEDTRFRDNIRGASDAGLEAGVYFFSQAVSVEEAEEEARFVLDLLKDCDITGPVVFDWENISNAPARTDGVDSATLTAAANAFCTLVEEAGYQPMIYFNQYIAYLLYDLEGVAQYPFWLAQYSDTPDFHYNFQMWQYTDAGQVAGIQGKADLNLRLLPW